MLQCAFIYDDVRIPPQRQIGLHSHSSWELSHVVCGTGTRIIGDVEERISPGEIILIPPNIPHVWTFSPTVTDSEGNIANISVFFDTSLIMVLKDILPEMAQSLAKIASLQHAVAYRGERYNTIRLLLEKMRGKTPEQRLPLMMELLTAISDFSDSVSTGHYRPQSPAEQRLEKVRVYCACNYANPISLEEISRHVGMSKSGFCIFMHHSSGTTFTRYLNDMRLERAKDKLLNTNYPVAEIALLCGFQNVTYFNTLFRTKYGCTPKGMRTAYLNQ